jgi:hypothetical protein
MDQVSETEIRLFVLFVFSFFDAGIKACCGVPRLAAAEMTPLFGMYTDRRSFAT